VKRQKGKNEQVNGISKRNCVFFEINELLTIHHQSIFFLIIYTNLFWNK